MSHQRAQHVFYFLRKNPLLTSRKGPNNQEWIKDRGSNSQGRAQIQLGPVAPSMSLTHTGRRERKGPQLWHVWLPKAAHLHLQVTLGSNKVRLTTGAKQVRKNLKRLVLPVGPQDGGLRRAPPQPISEKWRKCDSPNTQNHCSFHSFLALVPHTLVMVSSCEVCVPEAFA